MSARGHVEIEFCVHGCAEIASVAAPLQALDHLLRTKRKQDTEHDNSHLAEKGAPAVQRLGQTKAHAAGPPATTWEPNRRAHACNGWKGGISHNVSCVENPIGRPCLAQVTNRSSQFDLPGPEPATRAPALHMSGYRLVQAQC